ncbi:phosphoglycerate mutase (2,3-diphosphoglycerate-dependent) [Skeletonema marinoi]|uniref:Phosphoglycerate mutase n=1 Tax=Skeletonema marinoi TaxID=267567 RepID=A0AAD9DK30_9STRA|nr:phosphoglycerate mutase (2,3-diphosphoglycerate-dependent) [Skeletonema marinoi]
MIMMRSLLLLCSLSTAAAFVAPGRHTSLQRSIINSDISQTGSSTELFSHKIVLVRHGESEWNDLNIFTGWADAALNEKGVKEAKQGGQYLKEAGFTFDVAYTSVLKRAIKTLWLVLEEMDLMYIPIINTWRLNERHYGGLQGLNKQETVDKHGKDQVLIWRRSYDIPPPECDESSEYYPGNDPRYANVDKADLPFTESLKITGERFMPVWENEIVPDIKAGKKILIAAHGNTLRALVKHLDGISEDEICGLNIPTGVPLVYELDDDLNVIPNENAIAPLRGLYLGNLEDVRARIEGVANQTK